LKEYFDTKIHTGGVLLRIRFFIKSLFNLTYKIYHKSVLDGEGVFLTFFNA